MRNADCEQCGRCCTHILLPFHAGATFDPVLCALRGIIVQDNNLVIPCHCNLDVSNTPCDQQHDMHCAIYDSKDFSSSCRSAWPGGKECMILHEALP